MPLNYFENRQPPMFMALDSELLNQRIIQDPCFPYSSRDYGGASR